MTYAEAETKMFSVCRDGAYVDTRRGMSRKPAANSGKNVRLKKTKNSQKWILPSFSFSSKPASSAASSRGAEEREDQAAHDRVVEVRHDEVAPVHRHVARDVGEEDARQPSDQEVEEERDSEEHRHCEASSGSPDRPIATRKMKPVGTEISSVENM